MIDLELKIAYRLAGRSVEVDGEFVVEIDFI